MAEHSTEIYDPERQAAPFIPPFPKELSSPQEYMKANGWKPLSGELGFGFQLRAQRGWTSSEEDRIFAEMQRREEAFTAARQGWTKAYANQFAGKLLREDESLDFRPGAQMPSPEIMPGVPVLTL